MDYEKLYKELLTEKESVDLKLKEYEGLEEKYKQSNTELEEIKKNNSDLKIELYDLHKKKLAFEKNVEFTETDKDTEKPTETKVLELDDLVQGFI